MFFIFGFGSKEHELGAGQTRTCGRCGNTTVWNRLRTAKQFTLFFIPIARWGRRELEVCTICGNAVTV
ncbi:zinc-ribbon domain-containing protein [Agrococcus sp. Marseille-P2731]|uniref:zinc-ribbon domain-containing protein n=1 Tax=Agrococcus sp. Marseille-P2731 TaxID=1841862 RepID=UPI0009313230|nr:zinc-ribbon domain-containing protein [Agrococcus sp. Marseille-P2731]